MALDSYANLQTAVETWLNRNDITSVAGPDIVTLAESRLRRDPRLQKEGYLSASVSGDGYSLPSDFRSLTEIFLDSSASGRGPLDMVSPAQLAQMKAGLGASGIPQAAAIRTDTDPPTMDFGPAPDGTYTLEITYELELEALSDANTSNWLLTEGPDIYLFACLAEAELFLQEDQRSGVWEQKLDQALNNWKLDYDRRKFGGTLIARPRRALGV